MVGQAITDPISGPSLSFVFCLLALSLTILTSDNILSIPRVDVVVHISSPIIASIAIVVVSSVVHHVRPGIP